MANFVIRDESIQWLKELSNSELCKFSNNLELILGKVRRKFIFMKEYEYEEFVPKLDSDITLEKLKKNDYITADYVNDYLSELNNAGNCLPINLCLAEESNDNGPDSVGDRLFEIDSLCCKIDNFYRKYFNSVRELSNAGNIILFKLSSTDDTINEFVYDHIIDTFNSVSMLDKDEYLEIRNDCFAIIKKIRSMMRYDDDTFFEIDKEICSNIKIRNVEYIKYINNSDDIIGKYKLSVEKCNMIGYAIVQNVRKVYYHILYAYLCVCSVVGKRL